MSRASKSLNLALLLALPIVSLLELGAHLHFRRSGPSVEDWQQLKSVIVALYGPNTLVTSAPRWTDPLLRQALGDELLPLDLLARADDDTLERAIEISVGDARDSEFADWIERSQRRHGPFSIRVLDNPRFEPVRLRLLDRVEPSSLAVWQADRNTERVCPFTSSARVTTGGLGGDPTLPARRFACPSGEPYLVGVTTIDDEHFAPRRCIWAHPSPNGATILRFSEVWLGRKLVGHAGLPWLISRDGIGTPVKLEARFEGTPIGQVTVEDTSGWIRFEWSTQEQRDRRGELELAVSSEQARNRRFCFTLEAR